MTTGFQRPPIWQDFASALDWQFRVPMQGKLNCVAELTLDASTALTVFSDPRLGPESVLAFMPQTANAAADFAAGIYVDNQDNGSADIHHTNDADNDKTFLIAIIG